MPGVAFNHHLIELLQENRTPLLTALFQLFTFLGDMGGYVLVIAFVYGMYDKKLAIRLTLVVLVTMSLNHLLKTLIANPRPFIADGSYATKWAVSEATAADLAAEFSTPSGHAMAAASFYTYLYANLQSPWMKAVAIGTILLIGLSRPYLGVHYVEDVVLGWTLGAVPALLATRFGPALALAWNARRWGERALIVVGASLAVLLGSAWFYGASAHGQPVLFVSYLGLLSGIVLAHPLEERWVAFDPRSSTLAAKALRVLIAVLMVAGTSLLLDRVFGWLADDGSLAGNVLRYIRYAAAAVIGVLVAPLLFVRLGLAQSRPGS